MEDYELLALAAKLGAGAQAKAIAQGVFPKTYQATTSPAALDSARAELAALILHALGKDTQTTSSGGSGSTSCTTTACTDGSGNSPAQPATQTPPVAAASTGGGGGCSTHGGQSVWLAIPALALFVLRRRRGSRA